MDSTSPPNPSCNVILGNTRIVCVGFQTQTVLNGGRGGEGGEFVCFDDMVVSRAVTTLYRTVSTVLSRVVGEVRRSYIVQKRI